MANTYTWAIAYMDTKPSDDGLTDVVMSSEMATYRQALRDITDQVGFPNTVVWPVKP